MEVRGRNFEWLAPWEATPPRDGRVVAFPAMVRNLTAQARRGQMMPFVVTYEGRLVGQLTVGGITWGSLCAAHIGYWVDSGGGRPRRDADGGGAGHRPLLRRVGLHRIEINIRPENTASLRVVEKLGFRDEGLRRAFLHIDGAWRDHRAFALTAEELPPAGCSAAGGPPSHTNHTRHRTDIATHRQRCVCRVDHRPTVLSVGSGLIYAAIIVMWALYFIPRWLRRHEELSESRSVEKFDHAMRILSRRDPTPDQRYIVMPPKPEPLAPPARPQPPVARSSERGRPGGGRRRGGPRWPSVAAACSPRWCC